MFLKLNEIDTIQLDHTSRCNCSCPQCARMQLDGTVNPKLPITDLTLTDYEKILAPFDNSKIDLIHCGNYGDAPVSPTFDETLDYCLDVGVRSIRIMTNGSMRTPDWWRELALKSNGRVIVVFSIDGLADTNHLYRVGSNFNNIMANAKAFIDAGGNAKWVFIKFNHNYHQVDEAHQLAIDMGFRRFSVKTSARFVEQNTDTLQNKNNDTIKDIPNNSVKANQTEIIQKYTSFDNYVNTTPINCKYKNSKTIFIDMCMRVWPCCWLGAPEHFNHYSEQTPSFDHITKLYGNTFNNLRVHNWDLLTHEFYNEYLQNSWDSPDNRYKRIYACGRTCGGEFGYSGTDEKNINNIELGNKNA